MGSPNPSPNPNPNLLGDAAALDDTDAVGVADGGEAVGDHEDLVRVRVRG